jgi:hypothetical protein
MWKHLSFAAAVVAAMIFSTLGAGAVFAQQLLSSFENDLSSSVGTPWTGDWTVDADFTSTGATEGSSALVVNHSPVWLTHGSFLVGGVPLAQVAAQHDFLLMDVTTTDLGMAGDGWHPDWRQVFAVFNSSSQGGWMQNQLDFPVAADDGGTLTQTLILDLAATGIKANAQAYVDSGGGEGTWFELFLIWQGGDLGTPVKAGDYNADNMVDAADYVVWRKNVGGTTLPNETASLGVVDDVDYAEWQTYFGSEYGSGITSIIDNIRFANAGSGAGSAVPEPSSAVLALAAGLAFAGCRRKRN